MTDYRSRWDRWLAEVAADPDHGFSGMAGDLAYGFEAPADQSDLSDALLTFYRGGTEFSEFDDDVHDLLSLWAREQAALPDDNSLPAVVRLDTFLQQPDPAVTYRIEQLWPADGRILFAAQYKAGKTTGVANLLRSWADLDPFLGTYPIAPPPGPILLLDDELHENTLRRWLRGQQIVNTDRVHLVSLRGRTSTFRILDDATRDAWARQIADTGASGLVLDCLRPIIDALGLSEDKDTGKVLEAFDDMLTTAGMSEAAVVHHMGHSGERSRGDSRLRDWPDAEWRLVRQDDQPNSARYFGAYGRDVDQPEQRVELQDGRRLVVVGGSRQDAAAEDALDEVVAVIDAADGPLSGRAVEDKLAGTDHTRKAIREALKLGVKGGRIVASDGPRNATLHASAPVRGSAPSVRQRSPDECASAPIGGALRSQSAQTPSAPTKNDKPCSGCGGPSDRTATTGSRWCSTCWPEAGAA